MKRYREEVLQQNLELLHVSAFFSIEDFYRITARNALQQTRELRHKNIHDSLTGLLNREGLSLELKDKNPKDYLVLYADGNDLKHINDTQGHSAGDAAIKAFADALATGTRQAEDIIARVGGDEFVIIALQKPPSRSNISPEDQITAISDRICTQLPPELGISIGGVAGNENATFKELIALADAIMYTKKPTLP